MLKQLIEKRVPVKVCGTCMARCGVYKKHPYFDGAEKATMQDLAQWITTSEKVISF